MWNNHMKKIITLLELRKISNRGEGYIYNDFGTETNWNEYEFNVLHKASCRHIKLMTITQSKYYFESLDEAENWLNINRPKKWHKCSTCL